MKPFCITFFCFLTIVLYLLYSSITYAASPSSSSSSSVLLSERQTTREWILSISQYRHENHKTKVVVHVEGGSEGGYNKGDADGDGLVYHVDYQGVSTHPTPTPKHPRP